MIESNISNVQPNDQNSLHEYTEMIHDQNISVQSPSHVTTNNTSHYSNIRSQTSNQGQNTSTTRQNPNQNQVTSNAQSNILIGSREDSKETHSELNQIQDGIKRETRRILKLINDRNETIELQKKFMENLFLLSQKTINPCENVNEFHSNNTQQEPNAREENRDNLDHDNDKVKKDTIDVLFSLELKLEHIGEQIYFTIQQRDRYIDLQHGLLNRHLIKTSKGPNQSQVNPVASLGCGLRLPSSTQPPLSSCAPERATPANESEEEQDQLEIIENMLEEIDREISSFIVHFPNYTRIKKHEAIKRIKKVLQKQEYVRLLQNKLLNERCPEEPISSTACSNGGLRLSPSSQRASSSPERIQDQFNDFKQIRPSLNRFSTNIKNFFKNYFNYTHKQRAVEIQRINETIYNRDYFKNLENNIIYDYLGQEQIKLIGSTSNESQSSFRQNQAVRPSRTEHSTSANRIVSETEKFQELQTRANDLENRKQKLDKNDNNYTLNTMQKEKLRLSNEIDNLNYHSGLYKKKIIKNHTQGRINKIASPNQNLVTENASVASDTINNKAEDEESVSKKMYYYLDKLTDMLCDFMRNHPPGEKTKPFKDVEKFFKVLKRIDFKEICEYMQEHAKRAANVCGRPRSFSSAQRPLSPRTPECAKTDRMEYKKQEIEGIQSSLKNNNFKINNFIRNFSNYTQNQKVVERQDVNEAIHQRDLLQRLRIDIILDYCMSEPIMPIANTGNKPRSPSRRNQSLSPTTAEQAVPARLNRNVNPNTAEHITQTNRIANNPFEEVYAKIDRFIRTENYNQEKIINHENLLPIPISPIVSQNQNQARLNAPPTEDQHTSHVGRPDASIPYNELVGPGSYVDFGRSPRPKSTPIPQTTVENQSGPPPRTSPERSLHLQTSVIRSPHLNTSIVNGIDYGYINPPADQFNALPVSFNTITLRCNTSLPENQNKASLPQNNINVTFPNVYNAWSLPLRNSEQPAFIRTLPDTYRNFSNVESETYAPRSGQPSRGIHAPLANYRDFSNSRSTEFPPENMGTLIISNIYYDSTLPSRNSEQSALIETPPKV